MPINLLGIWFLLDIDQLEVAFAERIVCMGGFEGVPRSGKIIDKEDGKVWKWIFAP